MTGGVCYSSRPISPRKASFTVYNEIGSLVNSVNPQRLCETKRAVYIASAPQNHFMLLSFLDDHVYL